MLRLRFELGGGQCQIYFPFNFYIPFDISLFGKYNIDLNILTYRLNENRGPADP